MFSILESLCSLHLELKRVINIFPIGMEIKEANIFLQVIVVTIFMNRKTFRKNCHLFYTLTCLGIQI